MLDIILDEKDLSFNSSEGNLFFRLSIAREMLKKCFRING